MLVIPSAVDGVVTPLIRQEIREAGLPFPEPLRLGDVILLPSENPHYRAVAYAAVDAEQSKAVVEGVGRKLGWMAKSQGYVKFSMPVVDAGAGELSVAVALARGFQSTAPESAELWISVRDRGSVPAVAARLLGLVPPEAHPGTAKPKPSSSAPVPTNSRKSQSSFVRVVGEELRSIRRKRLGRTEAAKAAGTKPTAASQRQGVFISYSHADKEWLERLQKHLRPLQRDGMAIWDDTRLKPGEPWRGEIRKALAETKVAILLISVDFLASDFIVANELPPLLKAAEDEGAIILPVILSPCRFDRVESLFRFQAVNDPQRPLVAMRRANQEKILDQVARAVEDAFKQ